MPNKEQKITEKYILKTEKLLLKELKTILNKKDPGPNDYAFCRILHEKLIYIQTKKEKIRLEQILEKFRLN